MASATAPLLIHSIPTPAAVLCSGCAAALSWAGLRRLGWVNGPRRIAQLLWGEEGRWLLIERDGARTEASLASSARVGSTVVWLRWRGAGVLGPRRAMLLTASDVPDDAFRRLKVRLRLRGLADHDRQM